MGASRLRLLIFNLATDADDPVLGFATDWANALARHASAVDIVTMRVGRLAVADNVRVYSVGRERGYSRGRRLLNFYGILARLLLTHRYSACFAHMMPLFALLGGPLLRARGVPLTLWYTHRQPSAVLRGAAYWARRVVSADASSFPFPTPKLRALSHGIDTQFFTPGPQPPSSPFTVIHVARLMPIKGQETLLRAVAGEADVAIVLVGDVLEGYPDDYKRRLRSLAEELGLGNRALFTGNLPPQAVRDWYARATVAVNLSPVGLFDKAALESMSAALPTIVSNPAFDPILGEYAPLLRIAAPDDVDGLRERLRTLAAMPAEARALIGQRLRERVINHHDRDALIARLWRVLTTGEAQ